MDCISIGAKTPGFGDPCYFNSEYKVPNWKTLFLSSLCDEKMGVASDNVPDYFYGNLMANIFSMESQWLRTSGAAKQHAVMGNLEATRNRHIHQQKVRKRRIIDSVEAAYKQIRLSTKTAYLDVEGDDDAASAVASSTEPGIERYYDIRLLDKSTDIGKVVHPETTLLARMVMLSAELDALSTHLGIATTSGFANTTVPENLRNVLSTLTTMPLPLSALNLPSHTGYQQVRLLSFNTSSAIIQLPGMSRTLAALGEKSLLLADFVDGMSEVCSENGRKFSRWLPPVYDVPKEPWCDIRFGDSVDSVVALSDGRAAVGLLKKHVVVILRRCKKGKYDLDECGTNSAWTEYRRLDPLRFPPTILAGHGDVLAAGTKNCPEIQLLNICTGRHLGPEIYHQYPIRSLAVCSTALITGSYKKVKLGGRCIAHVIDAHCLENYERRMWRRELKCDQELRALCADAIGGCLYAAVSEGCSSQVVAISLADGSLLRHVLTIDEVALRPLQLSAVTIWSESATDEQQSLQHQNDAPYSRSMALALFSHPKIEVNSKVVVYRGCTNSGQ